MCAAAPDDIQLYGNDNIMNKINPKQLIENKPIAESLFAPLYFKASETHRDNPIVVDTKAVEILKMFDCDFSYFEKNKSGQFLIPVRTKILDEQVEKFLSETTKPVIINLGAGLDTRFSRIQVKKCICWYDIDLSEVIELRSHFFKNTDKNKLIGRSVLDYSWIQEINMDTSFSYPFVVEGLLMYFSENEVMNLFFEIKKNFPSAIMLCVDQKKKVKVKC
jgi:O-methyltransferase involved in polyketide biosynthesis